MKPYVEQTLREIEEQITQLQSLARGLRALPSLGPATVPVNGVAELPRTRRNGERAGGASAPAARVKGLKLIDAMREFIAKQTEEFSTQQIREAIERDHPPLKKRMSSLCVNLIDMSRRGEVHRKGVGSAATYRKGNLKAQRPRVAEAYEQFRSSIAVPTPAE